MMFCRQDHGFKTGNKRIGKLPGFSADIALEHEDDGFLCLSGPDFKPQTEITGATLLDITPTFFPFSDCLKEKTWTERC
ncbi:MAG: hypothetical protein RL711_1102 [Bacteroidota bacterium]